MAMWRKELGYYMNGKQKIVFEPLCALVSMIADGVTLAGKVIFQILYIFADYKAATNAFIVVE